MIEQFSFGIGIANTKFLPKINELKRIVIDKIWNGYYSGIRQRFSPFEFKSFTIEELKK